MMEKVWKRGNNGDWDLQTKLEGFGEPQSFHHGKRLTSCGKSFGQSMELISQHRIQVGEKSCVCPSFAQRSHLIGERSYMGQECRKSFGRSPKLIKPQEIHTGEPLWMPRLWEGLHREPQAPGTPVGATWRRVPTSSVAAGRSSRSQGPPRSSS